MACAPHETTPPVAALDAFVGLVDEVDRDADREAFYGSLAEAICRLSEMRRAIVFRYDPARRRVTASGSHGIAVERYADVPVDLESAEFAREALLEDRVTEAWPPFEDEVPDAFLPEANEAPLVAVPIRAAGRMIGVVVGQRAIGAEPLEDGPRHWLWTLGKVAALAASARIATFEQQRARSLEDRIDLAREIHDEVVQRLSGVSMILSAAPGDLDATSRARCAQELQTAMAELRAALERPLGREPRRTGTTLADLLERLPEGQADLALRVTGDPGDVPRALEPLAQSVLVEALVNARRHAEPRRLDVDVRRSGGAFVLEVANDGVPVGERRPRVGMGMGLRLAAFSALRAGGVVEFGPRADGWWQVRLVVPDSAENRS